MAYEDIRWIQRFNNYRKALARLGEAVQLAEERELSDLEQQGLIQGFEFTFDLAWKTLQDYLRENKRPNDNGGPNVIITQSLEDGIIKGMYRLKKGGKSKLRAQLMGSGTILREVMAGAELLEKDWGIAGDARSVTRTVNLTMDDNMRFTPDKLSFKFVADPKPTAKEKPEPEAVE
mgnify:CR=1 FL=1